MKRDSNSYIFLYSTLLIVVVAVLLAVAATALRPAQLENEKTEKRVQIPVSYTHLTLPTKA